MWLQHFGFQEDPFGVSPNPRYLYPSRTHQEALESLEHGFYSNRGFIAMIAPPGMGKTTLLYRFLEDTQETARRVFLFDIDAECEPRDFVGHILRGFGITPERSSFEMHRQLSDFLVKETAAGRKCVVVIDEAQNLSDAVLERVRLLTNFETSQGKLLQIILSGQPQLNDKLMQASLVQLRQRVSTVCRLEPLSAQETTAYIDYRLKQAGYNGAPPFTKYALRLIAEASHGTPRTINNLCFNALSLCFAMKNKQVNGSMVAKVIANLQLLPELKEPIPTAGEIAAERSNGVKQWRKAQRMPALWGSAVAGNVKLWVPAAALLLVTCVLGVLRLTEHRAPQARTTVDNRSLNLNIAPASVPAPTAADDEKTIAAEPTPNMTPFAPRDAVGHHDFVPASAAAAVHQPLQVSRSIPKPSAAAVQSAPPVHELMQANGLAPKPWAAPPAVAPSKASTAPQSPSMDAGANPVIPQQSPARARQSGSPAGVPTGAVVTRVRPALAGNALAVAQAAPVLTVRPALPMH
jgi:type II secretory pathway predicted ATPase ExeA